MLGNISLSLHYCHSYKQLQHYFYKKDKETADHSYCPISLLTPLLILSKVLVESVLPQIISVHQTGFIKVDICFSISGNIINMANPLLPSEVSVWKRRRPKQRFSFGDTFVSWSQLLYSNLLPSGNTNSLHSSSFHLYTGTCQGCPTSLLLFTTESGITWHGVNTRLSNTRTTFCLT